MRWALAALLAVGASARVQAQDDLASGAVLRAMHDEIARSMESLAMPGAEKPYYVAYAVVDFEHAHLVAAYGAITLREQFRQRMLEADVRVGSYDFDSSAAGFDGANTTYLPIDDDYDALRREMWLLSDTAYKEAVEGLEKKRAAQAQSAGEEQRADFTRQAAHTSIVAGTPSPLDLARWAAAIQRLSLVFGEFPGVQYGKVELASLMFRRHFASSEGAVASEPSSLVQLHLVAQGQADDGMPVADFASFTVPVATDLPDEAKLAEEVRRLCREVEAMRIAPKLERYTGPILFEGFAAAQFTRALLMTNLGGTPPPAYGPKILRMDHEFADKLDRDVMPRGFHVVDDPLETHVGKEPLVGHYRIDDEGVPAQRVDVIEDGKLRALLMSRTPRKSVGTNGHARGPLGNARGMPSNLFVSGPKGLSPKALRHWLVERAKQRGEKFGLVVRRLEDASITGLSDWRGMFMRMGKGGVTVPAPLVAFRVHPDGREELVRGVNLPSVPVRALRDLGAWGNTASVHGFGDTHFQTRTAGVAAPQLGALMSPFPISVVVPDLVVEELDVTEVASENDRPPLYEHPPKAPPGHAL